MLPYIQDRSNILIGARVPQVASENLVLWVIIAELLNNKMNVSVIDVFVNMMV